MYALALVWRASRARVLLTVGAQALASVSLLAQVLLVEQVLSVAFEGSDEDGTLVERAILPIVLLAVLTAATAAASTLGNLQHRALGEHVNREVWRRILDVSRAVELAAYEDPEFYDRAQRVRVNAAERTQNVVHAIVIAAGDALAAGGAAVAVVALAPALLPVLLVSSVPVLLTSRVIARREFRFEAGQTTRERERLYLQGVLTRRDEAKEVRAFALSGPLQRRWERNYAAYLLDLRRHVNARLRLALLGTVGSAVLLGVALLMVVVLVDRGRLSLAAAGGALLAVRLLAARVGGATYALGEIAEAAPFLQDLRHFLAERPPTSPTDEPLTSLPPSSTPPRITVTGVGFAYPQATEASLESVSLEINPGEVIALVGANGSGKSTLAKLLANLYRPTRGVIEWDGVDVGDMDPDAVRSRIAVLFQDFVRYQLTARDNIQLGHPDGEAADAAVRRAAQQADADDFLTALPSGYDTVLSKEYVGGSDLSVGQWQRLSLARAFIRDAPLVILDEPSASLDPRAESDLFEQLRVLCSGRSVVVISHRFSTVRSADRIYVLSDGRIVEEGDHESLMACGGQYAELYELQASAYR
ncbi:ABC transporter ATP-binding protein [Blastococcus sp. SYSU D00813]